jgi:hypothetical protein
MNEWVNLWLKEGVNELVIETMNGWVREGEIDRDGWISDLMDYLMTKGKKMNEPMKKWVDVEEAHEWNFLEVCRIEQVCQCDPKFYSLLPNQTQRITSPKSKADMLKFRETSF